MDQQIPWMLTRNQYVCKPWLLQSHVLNTTMWAASSIVQRCEPKYPGVDSIVGIDSYPNEWLVNVGMHWGTQASQGMPQTGEHRWTISRHHRMASLQPELPGPVCCYSPSLPFSTTEKLKNFVTHILFSNDGETRGQQRVVTVHKGWWWLIPVVDFAQYIVVKNCE